MTEYTLETDPLAVGLTRPAMCLGVPLKVLFANGMACTLVYIYTKSMMALLLFVMAHGIVFLLTLREPRFFELLLRAMKQTPPLLNRAFWGGINSYGAF